MARYNFLNEIQNAAIKDSWSLDKSTTPIFHHEVRWPFEYMCTKNIQIEEKLLNLTITDANSVEQCYFGHFGIFLSGFEPHFYNENEGFASASKTHF